MEHIYYRLKIILESPMSIGSGKEEETDHDIVLNSKGEPYIPGTTLAGVYRSLFAKKAQEKLFGYIDGTNHLQSPLVVYDAKCTNYSENISIRDSVRLDEYKVAETGAKFDFQVAETGLEFVSYIELDKRHTKEMVCAIENQILPALNSGKILLGHKTTRGYGQIGVKCQRKTFDLCNEGERDIWLDFDMFDDKEWCDGDSIVIGEYKIDSNNETVIKIPLIQKGAISIRRYLTEAEENQPDYEQLSLKYKDENGKERPVIPGTSWAGAFRHR